MEEQSSIAGRGASLDGVSEEHSVEERSSIAGRGASLDGNIYTVDLFLLFY